MFANVFEVGRLSFKKKGKTLALEGGNQARPHIIFSSVDERDRIIDISLFSGNKIRNYSLYENNRERYVIEKGE